MEMQETVVVVGLPGTVRCNMLANFEALLNIGASAFELTVIAFGIVFVLAGLLTYHRSTYKNPLALFRACKKAHIGAFLIKFGLLVPWLVNWLVAAGRDASLFN